MSRVHPTTVGLLRFLTIFGPLALLVALAACAGNPVRLAQTNQTRAYALLGEYMIVQATVADTLCGPALIGNTCPGNAAIPENVVRHVQALDARATPIAKSLAAAALAAARALDELAAGTGSVEKVNIANANLLRWITELQPLIEQLRAAI